MTKKNTKASETAETKVEGKEAVTETKELSFSKQAFLSSKGYKPHRDLIKTLLKDGQSYTKSEVNQMIDDYLKGEVK